MNVDAADIHLRNTGSAHCGENPPPVGIAGESGRLDQGRLRDRIGNQARLGNTCRIAHFNLDEARRALAVTHDGLGQFHAHRLHRGRQHRKIRMFGGHRLAARGTGGDQHAGIVGGCVPVHGDAVEGSVHRIAQQA